ncbi:hypothetical protein [Aquirufa salirivi]|uniref:Phage abortive infection protein n=1 Tax=Aquirufa salirivi TaxID=3104729 RepID=A0ABW8RX23_9BACT
MVSIFSFQIGDFCESDPNWFDWLSLIVSSLISIFSVLGGFLIAKKIYSKEKKDKKEEETEIQKSEIKLFKNSLSQLNTAVSSQINSLEEYIENQNFSLKFNQGIQVDFLQFIDVKYLYKDLGVDNIDKIAQINTLLSTLYTLNDFRISLRDELRTYMRKYNFHEDKFYSYRKLIYTKYFEVSNLRGKDFNRKKGDKIWRFNNADKFMQEYSELRNKILKDKETIFDNELKDRKKLNERFVIPLIYIAKNYIPEDYNAIELSDISNEVNTAFNEMEHLTKSHFKSINSYLELLKNVRKQINQYLQ